MNNSILSRIVGTSLSCLVSLAIISPALAVKIPIAGVSQDDNDSPLNGIRSVTVSPDGQTLALVANLMPGSTDDFIYTVPISGGTPTLISDTGPNFDKHLARFTADGSELVFIIENNSNIKQLHRVPVTGGTPTMISPQRVSTGFQLTNNDDIVFLSRVGVGGEDFLHKVALAGGMVTQLSFQAQGDIDRTTFDVSPDGSTIAFASDATAGGGNEDTLFTVPFSGGTPTNLQVLPQHASPVDIDTVEITADGNILFQSDFTANQRFNIHTVPLTGGAATELVDLTLIDEDMQGNEDVGAFAISPDGLTIAFAANHDGSESLELYVMPITGGTPVLISDPFTAEAIDLDITGDGVPDISDGIPDGGMLDSAEGVIAWTPDSRKVIYIGDGEVFNAFEAYIVDNPFAPAPPPGDYNGDGFVDAADYTVWRDTLGQTVAMAGDGADGDMSGDIGTGDYDFWKANFGSPGASRVAAATIPEPTGLLLMLGAAMVALRVRIGLNKEIG